MCIIDLPDPGLMRAVELADFMDEVDSADPDLLTLGPGGDSPRSPDAVLMSAPAGDYGVHGARGDADADVDCAAASMSLPAWPTGDGGGFPASGSSYGDAGAWGAPPPGRPPKALDDSPRSCNALPTWVVPDHVALESCLDKLLSDARGMAAPASVQPRVPASQSMIVGKVVDDREFHEPALSVRASAPASMASPDQSVDPSSPTVTISDASSAASPESTASTASTSTCSTSEASPPPELVSFRLKDAERSRMRRRRQKNEFAQLRLRIQELEEELALLRRQEIATSEEALEKAIVHNLVPMPKLLATSEAGTADDNAEVADANADDAMGEAKQLPTGELWERLAGHHKEELEKSRLRNLRLRAEAEQQLRVLKQIEVAFRSIGKMTRAQRRGLLKHRGLFPNEDAVFEFLRVNVASLYMESDRVYKSSGMGEFDGDMAQMAVPHTVGGDGDGDSGSVLYIENMDSKVFPFRLKAVSDAVWHSLTTNDPTIHPGFYKIIEANDDTVTVKIADYVRLPQAETLVTVWLTARRYVEDERVVTVWNAFVEMEGPVYLKLLERGWNVLRPLRPTNESRSPSMCVTQTLMRVTPVLTETFSPSEVAPDSLGMLLMGCYHRTVIVMFHVLEKLLLTEAATLTSG